MEMKEIKAREELEAAQQALHSNPRDEEIIHKEKLASEKYVCAKKKICSQL